MNVLKFFFGITALFTLFSPATILFAAPDCSGAFSDGPICYEPLTSVPGITNIIGTNEQTTGNTSNPAEMVTGFYKFAIGIASVGAVVMIMWGGLEYMTTEAFTGKSNAKNRITYALVGLILLSSSYIILRTINRDLITFKISLPQGSKFLSDAAQKAQKAQQNIDNVTSLTAKLNREINEKRQTMVQDQAVLDGLKKELANNKDPEKAAIIQKQIDEAQKTFNQSEKVFNETVIAGQKEVVKSGVAAYMDAGDYARALTYTSMQEKATARELEMLKNDPVDGENALREKQSAEIAKATAVYDSKHKLEGEAIELKEKLTKINEQIIVVQNGKGNSEEEKKAFLADLEKEKVAVQTKINTNQENLTEKEKEWKEADAKLSAVTTALEENKKKAADVNAGIEKDAFNKSLLSEVVTNTTVVDGGWLNRSESPIQKMVYGEDTGTNSIDVPKVDKYIADYMDKAEKKALEYEQQGKPDLALSVREVAEKGKQAIINETERAITVRWGTAECEKVMASAKTNTTNFTNTTCTE